jgi:hypothetical protein
VTGLLRLLAAILGAHIERDDLPPAVEQEPDPFEARLMADFEQLSTPPVNFIPRPCWCCGVRAAFDAHTCRRPATAVDQYLATLAKIHATAEGIAQLGNAMRERP